MSLRRQIWKRIALAGLLSIAVLLVGAIWYLHTAAFRSWALGEVVSVAEARTGTHVQIQSLDLRFYPFRAEFNGVTVHGAELADEKPLFQADRVQIGLRLLPLLHKQAQIDQIVVERPRVFVWTDSQGRNNLNLPAAKSSSGAGARVEVRYAAIHDGLIIFGDETVPVAAELYQVQAELNAQMPTGYRGRVSYEHGRVATKNFRAIEHSLSATVTLDE